MEKEINIAFVKKSVMGGNNIQVTAIDDSHAERIINLSPSAREAFLKALLEAESVGSCEQDAKSHKTYLVAQNLRLFEGPDRMTGIEFFFGSGIAIHILLQGVLPESAKNLLHQFRGGSPYNPH
jgi:hypothetical protein